MAAVSSSMCMVSCAAAATECFLLPWNAVAPVVLLAVWLYQLGSSRFRAVSYARRHSCYGYWHASALGRGPPVKGQILSCHAHASAAGGFAEAVVAGMPAAASMPLYRECAKVLDHVFVCSAFCVFRASFCEAATTSLTVAARGLRNGVL